MLLMYCCSKVECGHVFVRTDERMSDILSECPKCGNKTFFKCDFRSWAGYDEEVDESDFSHYDELSEKFKLLKTDADYKNINLSDWKGRMVLYHNELWKVLAGNEPEKYRRDCPVKK